MNTFADYEAWKAKRQSAGVGAASVVIGAQEQSPDQLAGDLNLANEFGKVTGNPVPPVPMVGEYRSVFQAAIEKKRAETILSSSPRLTEWLRNPENAGVARDDLEGLSWWETGLGATWNATKRGAMRAGPQAYNQYQANVYAERAQDAGRSFGEILRDERTPILNADGKEVDRVWAGPSDLLGAGYRYAASRLTNLWGQSAEQNAAQYQARAGQIANRIAQIPMSPGGEAGKARFMEAAKAEGWQAQLSAIGKAFTEAPGEMTSFLLQTAAESLPSMAAAAGVGVATRSPGAAAAVMGGTSFAAEYGSAPVEFFKEKGIDVSTPEGAMSVIRNPEIMREAEQRGIIRGVIIGALDGLSGGIAGTKLAESALGNIVLQSITQAVLGASGEAGAQVAAGQNFNLAEVVLEGLAEFATAPVEVSGMAVSRVREAQAKARDAEARVGLFQELSGQAVASKLRARMPDRFRQFIEQATANGPVENVFVPAQEFVTYFQSVGVDPYELLGELDGVSRDDLDAALAGGGDLKIPTATYAAKIAGSEHDAFLMQNMRFDPMDMTAREAAEFNARVDEVMAEMWAEAEDVRLEDEKWRAVEAKIYDDMVSRLRMAGRSTEVATTEAMIYPAFYRVMAERSGLSTEEFLERYPLPQVQGAVPQGMQFKDVDDLTRTLAELRLRVKPTTKQTPLLDFIAKRGGIDDVGGELKARNADGQLRPGMGRLARRLTEYGKPMPLTDAEMKSGARFGWDYTAQAAVEAGFMADNPAVIEWKDAMAKGDRVAPDLIPVLLEEIDRELAGQGGTVDENTAALDEMEEYLSRLGVSLDDSDEAIRAVLEAAQAEDARMYGQDGEVRSAADVGSDPTAAMDAVISSLGGEVISRSYDVSGFGDEVVLRVNGTDLQLSVREDALGVYLTSIASKKAGDLTEKRAGSGVGAAAINALKAYADRTGKPFAVVGSTEPARGFYEKMGMVAADVTLFMDDGYLTSPASGDGGGGFVYRPAGSAQIATESDAFKAWFAGSKVVNDDGSPRVVYHGTDAEDFTAFKPGSWFSASQSEASAYSFAYEIGRRERAMGKYKAASMADLAGSRLEYGGSVSDFEGPEVGDTFATDNGVMRYAGKGRWEVATDLAIDYNAVEWADDGSATVSVIAGDNAAAAQGMADEADAAAARMFPGGDGGRVLPVYLSIQNPIKLPALEANRIANRLGMGDADIERVIAEYEAQGYDGIETESDEAATFAEVRAAEGGIPKQWIAFRPEQVKSVFNRGTFDLADPRILYQRGGALDGLLASVRENMARKASLSADLAAAGRPVMFSTADGRRAMAGPDMSKPGGFRLTYLDADGQPSGHSEFATLGEAIRRALDEGMEPSVAYQQAQDGVGSIEALAAELGVSLSISDRDGYVTVSRIIAGERGQGSGSRVMQAIADYADANGRVVALTPSSDFGGKVSRLREFYKRFGFVENKGKNKDFGTRETMIRDPKPVTRTLFQRAEGPRGQISVTADGKSTIRLFESANLSTMLHESGHFFLLVMQDLAAKGEANAAAEYEAIKGWWRENAKAVAADGNRAAGAMPGAYNQGGRTDTASDAFKRWFGDSKVVDGDGKPLVVYHGTAADFDAFDATRFGQNDSGWYGRGVYVSADKSMAEAYAGWDEMSGSAPEGGNVMPVYVSLQNPYYFTSDKTISTDAEVSREFTERLKAEGYDGVIVQNKYADGVEGDFFEVVAFSPTQIKSVFNRGTFDPADPRILYQDRTDPSLPGEKITITAEDVIRALDTGTTGDSVKDMLVDVGMQEQWARAFEAYLMEGKAPSVELRSAFEKFRAWLISVYRRIAGLNVQISDDIRAVFDRMLASDAEIEKAKRTSGDTGNMFASAEQMGLTAEEYDRFLKLRAQAEDDAKARLMGEIMDPIKREADKAYRAEKEKVRAEVERNINASPVFRALEWMGNRRWLGEGQPANLPDMRLSKAVLVQRYGEGVLKTLPRGKQTIYAVEGGLDPDDAAGWFGFDSGDQMIRALERAQGRKDAITAETDRVMNERHNDPLTDGEIERRALDAVHNDKRGQWIAAELEAVRKVIGSGVGLTAKEARASARQTIARMTVRDAMAAQRFLAAERKAAEEAARLGAMLARESVWANAARRRIAMKAKGALVGGSIDAVARQIETANNSTLNRNETVQKLIAAKRRQLMNHALYMEARAVADEVGKAERFVARLNKASTREKIAGAGRRENAQTDYLAALDEILDRYDFRKMSGRAEDRRGVLAAFIESMTAAGRENELAIPETVLRDAGRKPYKTLSVEELRGVIDSLKNIQHVATRWNDLIDGQNQRKLDEAVAEITAAFDENMPKRPPGRVATTGEGVRNSVRQFLDLVLNAGTILREIDGFKDMGAAYRNLKAPIDAAMDRLTVRKEKAAADLEALYAVYSKEERRRMAVREHIPALGYALSKWERIAVALNTGNEGNMQRLTDPRVRGSLTPAQVVAVLSTLDERDARFVQSVWDYVGTFRDDIAAREKRTTGVEPAWVEASPVVIGGMTLRGGYYPLKYDPRLSTLARDDEAQAIGEALQAGRFGKAQTKRGHLEARAKSSGRDVELDMSVLHRHVNQVIYDLELSEPVANSWKVLQSGGVRQAFMDAGRQADFDALETWLKDVAEGQLAAGDWINKNARRFKSNFTAAKLAFNIGTVAAQITGLSQTMVVVGKRDFLRGLQASFRAGVANEIAAKSAFMRQRQTTFNKDIADFYNDPKLGPYASRWGDIKRDWIGPASFWLMTKVQWFTVDIPTWLAGYQQGLRKFGGDEAKAIAHADAIVKRAQASGLFSDRSAIERGSVSRTTRQNDVVRLFTTLGSYMFAKFNVAYERTMVAGRTVREEGVSVKSAQEAASWALDVAFLFTLEAVAMAALKGKLPDDEDDEDEPGWAKFLAKETAMSVLGTIPFVRDVVSVGSGFEGGGAYGGITAEIAKPFQEIGQGEIDKGFVKSVISGTGLFTGLPSTQINRAVDAGWRAAEGEDVSPLEYLLGKRGK